MYLTIKDGIELRIARYGDDSDHYQVKNMKGSVFEIEKRLYDALNSARLNRRLILADEDKGLIPFLKKNGIIETSRFVKAEDSFFNCLILFPFSDAKKGWVSLCRKLNTMLPAASLLVLLIGSLTMFFRKEEIGSDFEILLYLFMFFFSLLFHELGHILACRDYGFKLYDMGIVFIGYFPMGLYVSCEKRKDAEKVERIQLALAGVEMNVLLAGILLLAAFFFRRLSGTLCALADINFYLVFVNLIPALGLDGNSALSAWCGVENISIEALLCLLSRKKRWKLFHSGFMGYFALAVISAVLLSNIAFWVMNIYYLIKTIGIFL